MRAVGLMVIALSFGAGGCDKLLATVIGVGITTSTPDPTQAVGLDPGLAGVLPFNDIEVKAVVGSAVGLGERESETSTAAPEPLSGASVKLLWPGKQVELCPDPGAPGSYVVTSVPGDSCGKAALEYLQGVEYTTRVETSDDIYTMDITLPGAITPGNVVFTPMPVTQSIGGYTLETLTLNAGLNVDWSGDPAADGKHAFVTLVRFNHAGTDMSTGWSAEPNNPVHDNFPKDAGAMAELIINAPKTNADISGTAFDTVGLYLLVLTPVEMSDTTSDNLMIGSGALAGTGTIFAFWVD